MNRLEFESWITAEVASFVRTSPDNRLHRIDGTPIFESPLVGFAAGEDPIFEQLKAVIGPFHLTPAEALAAAAERLGREPPPAAGLGVVSYVLPVTQSTRASNARMTDRPSEQWANTRLFGEQFNRLLESHLVEVLTDAGFLAIAPELDEQLFQIRPDHAVGWASTWSQRHVAFSAGHGTFGLCDALITPAGKAHRCGSLVVDMPLVSPERPTEIRADCLATRGYECHTCIDRCPVDAITPEGHDKERCGEFVFEQIPYIKEHYGIDIYGCGLCQTKVPCQARVPRAVDAKRLRDTSRPVATSP